MSYWISKNHVGSMDGSIRGKLVSSWGRNRIVKSIQRGTISVADGNSSGSASITEVVAKNSWVEWGGTTDDNNPTSDYGSVGLGYVSLTGTSVTINYASNKNARVVAYQVVELFPFILADTPQTGTISLGNGVSSNTATITSVDTTKSFVIFQGETYSSGVSTDQNGPHLAKLVLTDSTTVTANRATSNTFTVTVAFAVITFS